MNYQKDIAAKFRYIALNSAIGLVDLNATFIKPDGSEVPVAPLVLSEIGAGLYECSYTPDVLGDWTLKITGTTTNDKAIKSFKVVERVDADSYDAIMIIDGKVDVIDGKIDTIDGIVDGLATDITAIKGAGFNTVTDSLKAISEQIAPGGYCG
uniref:Uncharacterized protein n=1 Tax=viral metagenome TaxID=1070528 RepID=A0A6M3KH55_9ZZZZ